MLSTYNKPHLPFKQQLNLLKARGLEVSNDNAALAYLTRIGYYRLSAYWYPLRLPLITQDPITQKLKVSRQDNFCPGIKFENFTKKIRQNGLTAYQEWLTKYNKVLARSKEDFFKHYKNKYGLPLPIWVSVELWDFGMLSTFFKGMQVADKDLIAAKYGIQDFTVMESWLRTLNYVRNVAAHHSRLWNKNLIDQPKLPKKW